MKIRIKLLSDLCVYSGETFNSIVDTDVVYDEYGLPYIPAKRLKGCMREAFLELVEFGVTGYDEAILIKLFGTEGTKAAAFSMSDAYLERYEDLKQDLQNYGTKTLTHPQKVLNLYTYIRTQTSVDLKTGVAEENSLRSVRVVKKGVSFESDIVFQETVEKEEIELLKQAIRTVKHIGYHRSRGLGIVSIEVVEDDSVKTDNQKACVVNGKVSEGRNKLQYSIQLDSPMLCKCAEGNQAKTQVYIEGSKVLGMLAGAMGAGAFQTMMNCATEDGDELIVSNAYIKHGTERCTPIPASLHKKKDQNYTRIANMNEERMEVYDMLSATATDVVLSPVGERFADADGYVEHVETEINYHHKRPDNKAVGHATGNDNSAFYQLESICKNQTFSGYILASEAQAVQICEILKNLKNVRMGVNKSTQYGDIRFSIDKIEPILKKTSGEKLQDFYVKLNAPVLLYNDSGMYSADVEVLKTYLQELLGVEDLELKQSFLRYETIGGFNVTWNRRKPTVTALGMGSICAFHTETGIDSAGIQHLFVGERVNEGYGEIEISWGTRNTTCTLKRAYEGCQASESENTDIIQQLLKAECARATEKAAREDAKRQFSKCRKEHEVDAVVSKMLLIYKEQNTYEKMKIQVEGIETDTKRIRARSMSEDIGNGLQNSNPLLSEDEIYRIYARAYLWELKYLLRPNKSERSLENA